MLRGVFLTMTMLLAAPAFADEDARMSFGGDEFRAGNSVQVAGSAGDVFAAGNRVSVTGEVAGTVHMAGRNVSLGGHVGGNVYGAGMNVDIDGPVSGNVTLMGQSIEVAEPVSGNLRAMGENVTLAAPVAGSAILGGADVTIEAPISGDLSIAAEEIVWGDEAKVSGMVLFYTDDPESVDVPERVAAASQIDIREMSGWERDIDAVHPGFEKPGFWAKLGGLIGQVLITGLVAFALAALAPRFTASMRAHALEKPLRSLWMGALGLAAAAGATVVLAMTGIGLLLTPLTVFGAVLLGLAGYVVGAYLLGVWALEATGQGVPEDHLDRAIAAFVGAGLLAFAALIPFVGWWAVMAVLLIGIGGLVMRLFRPAFMASEAL